jgi:hypothetical protein
LVSLLSLVLKVVCRYFPDTLQKKEWQKSP